MFTFCYKLLTRPVFPPFLPLLSVSYKCNDHSHFFNFLFRQSNSPPPIRRQPTWSRSSLVRIKSSAIKWSDCWEWSGLLLLIWEETCLGRHDQVRSDENPEEHQFAQQVWWTSIVPIHVPSCGTSTCPSMAITSWSVAQGSPLKSKSQGWWDHVSLMSDLLHVFSSTCSSVVLSRTVPDSLIQTCLQLQAPRFFCIHCP